MNYFRRGDQIEVEFWLGDAPFIVMPTTVVEDTPERFMHFMAAGTRYLARRQADGSPVPRVVSLDEFRAMDTVLAERIWKQPALAITGPGLAHGVRVLFDVDTWEPAGMYVNLQRPLERTERGFRTVDDFLDILVRLDGSWVWKDEDELALAIERGRVTAGEATAIRQEGERVVAQIEARIWPFDRSLDAWRPDPGWTIPQLPVRGTA